MKEGSSLRDSDRSGRRFVWIVGCIILTFMITENVVSFWRGAVTRSPTALQYTSGIIESVAALLCYFFWGYYLCVVRHVRDDEPRQQSVIWTPSNETACICDFTASRNKLLMGTVTFTALLITSNFVESLEKAIGHNPTIWPTVTAYISAFLVLLFWFLAGYQCSELQWNIDGRGRAPTHTKTDVIDNTKLPISVRDVMKVMLMSAGPLLFTYQCASQLWRVLHDGSGPWTVGMTVLASVLILICWVLAGYWFVVLRRNEEHQDQQPASSIITLNTSL